MWIFILFPLLSFAHVIQDDVTVTGKERFSFKTVCSKMVKHESPLIDYVSGTEIDCMGKKIQVSDFCDKELAHDPYYIRAFADKSSKEVVCQSGKKVIFKFLCVKLTDRALCDNNAKSSCEQIRLKLAKRLENIHASFTKNEKGIKQLNCYFETPAFEKTI